MHFFTIGTCNEIGDATVLFSALSGYSAQDRTLGVKRTLSCWMTSTMSCWCGIFLRIFMMRTMAA